MATDAGQELWRAAEGGDMAECSRLLAAGVSANCAGGPSNWTALAIAVLNGSSEVLTLLLEHGANVDKADKYGFTPLMIAAYKGHMSLAAVLLDYGARVGRVNLSGRSALTWAASEGHAAMVALLLRHGASVNRSKENRKTALFFAAERGHVDCAMPLMAALLPSGHAVDGQRHFV